MGPLLDRVWSTIGVTVNPVAFQRDNNLIFKAGADALGIPGTGCPGQPLAALGVGSVRWVVPLAGSFRSIVRSYSALATGNCAVHADCQVDGVETQDGVVKAVGGRLIDPADLKPKGRFRVKARAVVSSAGPIGTPRFLLSSGLTDDRVVGQSLFIHPTSGQMGRFAQEIKPWHGVTQGYCVTAGTKATCCRSTPSHPTSSSWSCRTRWATHASRPSEISSTWRWRDPGARRGQHGQGESGWSQLLPR